MTDFPLSRLTELSHKYSQNAPRYTSYPTAAELASIENADAFLSDITFDESRPLSLYIHIPFCRELCYYCGCHKFLARDDGKSHQYINNLKSEISLWRQRSSQTLYQIHFGGGTPTFLSNEQIASILAHIHSTFDTAEKLEISIEADPRTCDAQRISELYQMGFNRFSFGVQDFDADVQIAINRIQPFDLVKPIAERIAELEDATFNLDLIYGLPRQSFNSFQETLKLTKTLKPNRISIFNYAHLPERFPEQRKIKEQHLPSSNEKLAMNLAAISFLGEQGYQYIGIDHYALPDDTLAIEQRAGRLHRNFQGYTTHQNCDLIGCGVSSISNVDGALWQNDKSLSSYDKDINANRLNLKKGLIQAGQDSIRWTIIKQLLCHFELNYQQLNHKYNIDFIDDFKAELLELESFQSDKLLELTSDSITITATGRLFARLIVKVFDQYSQTHPQVKFSRAI